MKKLNVLAVSCVIGISVIMFFVIVDVRKRDIEYLDSIPKEFIIVKKEIVRGDILVGFFTRQPHLLVDSYYFYYSDNGKIEVTKSVFDNYSIGDYFINNMVIFH